MKPLLLLLALTFASDTVISNPVTIEHRSGVDFTFQSIRDDNDYYLMIDLRSAKLQLGHGPCEVTVTIDTDSLLMPCTAGKSKLVTGRYHGFLVPGRYYRFVQESLTLEDHEIVRRILTANEVVFKIGEHEVKLTGDDHLKRLRSVVDSATIK